jgi:hypothetical protein
MENRLWLPTSRAISPAHVRDARVPLTSNLALSWKLLDRQELEVNLCEADLITPFNIGQISDRLQSMRPKFQACFTVLLTLLANLACGVL